MESFLVNLRHRDREMKRDTTKSVISCILITFTYDLYNWQYFRIIYSWIKWTFVSVQSNYSAEWIEFNDKFE